MHRIVIPHALFQMEEGLMLGNGDFSAVCCQQPGKIIFRLGKNDLWDRRLDLSRNPRPAHIHELRKLLESESLHCDGVTWKASCGEGTDSLRFRELCKPFPSMRNVAPCPKPGAILFIHYPADWPEVEVLQTLEVERGILKLECRSRGRLLLELAAVIHPQLNRLGIQWKRHNRNTDNFYGGKFFGLPELPEVHATLFRPTELPLESFRKQEHLEHGNLFFDSAHALSPLSEAQVTEDVLVQHFPDELNFYAALNTPGGTVENSTYFLRAQPESESSQGVFFAAVSTVRAQDAAALAREGSWEQDRRAACWAARKFWSRSRISFSDQLYEKCYYAAMHAKRCVLRRGVVPPGLFFPATLQDYSMWHGDYHLNYNYQSIFLGDYESNHLDTGDAYFDGIAPLMRLGEKISRDYYGIDGGCFIQLSGFPFETEDDYFGGLPLGRMAYMTGWVAAYFFRRWQWTRDRKFLKEQGYPALRKFAVFYAGFLERGNDGRYHAFPSNQGESEFSRTGCSDQPQVLQHACFALRAAAEAAEVLRMDKAEAAHWRKIASRLPECEPLAGGTAPEFLGFDGEGVRKNGIDGFPGTPPEFLQPGNRFHDWYAGQTPYRWSILLRTGSWKSELYDKAMQNYLYRWLLPNGLLRAMSASTHGLNRGGWTESLGIAGAIADMLLVSDEGGLHLFPGIPKGKSASFVSLRANGAFLVSAELDKGTVRSIGIYSEKGGICRIRSPWRSGVRARISWNGKTTFLSPEDGTFQIRTRRGEAFVLTAQKLH